MFVQDAFECDLVLFVYFPHKKLLSKIKYKLVHALNEPDYLISNLEKNP